MWKKIKPYIPKRYNIFIQKPRLFIWLCVSFLYCWGATGDFFSGFFVTLIMYALLISIALSNTLEKFLCRLEDARHIATNTEKERLNIIFEEVYQEVRAHYPHASKDIKLYIVDSIKVNACAIGRNSIIINRGVMEAMDDEEIRGILCHEMAHIIHGDTQISLLITVATNIYLWAFLIVINILRFFEGVTEDNIIGSILSFIRFIVSIAINLLLFIWTLILAGGSRKQEYKADVFAFEIGYGEQLLSALYKLYDMQINDKRKLMKQLEAGHPKIAYRIEKLEEILK